MQKQRVPYRGLKRIVVVSGEDDFKGPESIAALSVHKNKCRASGDFVTEQERNVSGARMFQGHVAHPSAVNIHQSDDKKSRRENNPDKQRNWFPLEFTKFTPNVDHWPRHPRCTEFAS